LIQSDRLLAALADAGAAGPEPKPVLSDMVVQRTGRVLSTSSVAATMPGPHYATYAASKAFVQSFAEAVRQEVAEAGVTVTALMPGPTDTEFFERAGMQGSNADEGPKDDPADVARDGPRPRDDVADDAARRRESLDEVAGGRVSTAVGRGYPIDIADHPDRRRGVWRCRSTR
jgi:NAD(P)-dependent dehydrogenase (short-subunit alcohol dehydrogenase family)